VYLAAQNFELFSNIQEQNKKNKKPTVVVDVLFKTYPMVQLSADPIWPDGTFKPAQE
jgi:hypothetical protein